MSEELVPEELQSMRRNLHALLRLLSDPEAQRQYERDVPVASIPVELVCCWFDDLYHPEAPWFRGAFSQREREVLAEFHQFYAQRSEALPCDGGVHELQSAHEWREITEKAAWAVAELGWVDPQSPE